MITLKWLRSVAVLVSLLSMPSVYAQKAGNPLNLNPNAYAAAVYFDDVCTPFYNNLGTGQPGRVQIQAATRLGEDGLSQACLDIISQRSNQSIQAFVEGIDPTGFISFKIDSLVFAQTQSDSMMDRMEALRHKGVASSALNSDRVARGGGASADSQELLDKKVGLWFRLNYSTGTKDQTLLTDQLDSHQFGGNVGMDYRLNDNAVIGGALGYRHSNAKFGSGGAAGKMDDNVFNLSGYFSTYLYKNLYLDAVVNYGGNKFSTQRNVHDLSIAAVLYTPDGSTSGITLSGGVALGYEFAANGWTITPSIHYLYVDSKIDAFAESGQGPFDLSYDKQHYTSSSARLDLNLAYAASTESAVWLPHLRLEAIKEFGANIDTFDVRFVNEDLGLGSTPPAPLPVQMDKLDDQYFRASLGVSAQFHNDVSAYLDYQQLLGFESVSLKSVVAGLRFQF